MRFSTVVAALAPVVSVMAQGKTIQVMVGANSSLTYTPANVTAANGDTIEFQFMGANHTVTQSTFAAPCTNLSTPVTGVDSGFMKVAGANADGTFPIWSFTVVNASAPMWFYSKIARQP